MSSSRSFAWTQYLDLARELAADTRSEGVEARLRSAVSRAYYAAFHAAKDFLAERDGFVPAGPDVHAKVWRHYLAGPGTGRQRKAVARNGRCLREERGKADYDNPFPDPDIRKAAEGALLLAREIARQVEALRS
jgi:uncharacterized protein (UPF0332 family)